MAPCGLVYKAVLANNRARCKRQVRGDLRLGGALVPNVVLANGQARCHPLRRGALARQASSRKEDKGIDIPREGQGRMSQDRSEPVSLLLFAFPRGRKQPKTACFTSFIMHNELNDNRAQPPWFEPEHDN